MEQTEATVAEQQADADAKRDPGAGVEAGHPEPNRAGEPEQQQQLEFPRVVELDQQPEEK